MPPMPPAEPGSTPPNLAACTTTMERGVRYDPSRDVWSPLSVQALASLLQRCPARWWLSGGWAIDHWVGRVSRPHGDIDISTLRPALPALLASLPVHLEPFAAMDRHLYPLALRLNDPDLHNIWLRDERHGRWVLQINIEAGDEAAWHYRRDPRIGLVWDLAVRDVGAIPTGSPAAQLLWKSPQPRPQDDADLALVLGILSVAERQWLAKAIHTAHPSSPWAKIIPADYTG
jgi:hypothetical protein